MDKWKMRGGRWVLFNLRLPPNMKARIESVSLRKGESQSELVRLAIDEYLLKHAESEEERKASEIATRQRRERINLMQPKDGFKTEMQVFGAWATIKKARKGFEELGILISEDFDAWIKRLEENKTSIDPENPERIRIQKKFDLLIARLSKEKALLEKKQAKLELATIHEQEAEYEAEKTK